MTKPVHFFLLPHQDDEFGVFYQIECIVERGERAICFFLTDGGFGGADPTTRNEESRHVLGALGVPASDIRFLGSDHGLLDGQLSVLLPDSFAYLKKAAEEFGLPDFIYIPAWEGGHQDHDAAHILGIAAAEFWNARDRLRQFSLYNADRCGLRPYRVLAPIVKNGPVEALSIPVARRMRHLRLCLCYRSQMKTFAGLLPFVAAHYALRGVQNLQEVSSSRVHERPHEGILLYERFQKTSFADFKNSVSGFLNAHVPLKSRKRKFE